MSAALRIVEPGLLSQLQGAPYRGCRDAGMPLAGAADPVARAIANWIAGNGAEAAAIETSLAPFACQALRPVVLGIAGAAAEGVSINDAPAEPHRTLHLDAGDTLRIAPPRGGCRTYVALGGGGFACAKLMGARSTYAPGGFGGVGLLQAGDRLAGVGEASAEIRTLPPELRLPPGEAHLLRVIRGPESTPESLGVLTRSTGWTVGRRADRTGIELEGESLPPSDANMLSGAVFPGTIQAPPGGRPFLLGPDAATMGGYPRVAQIIRADRHLIGQLRPGTKLRLVAVQPDEAREIYRGKTRQLRRFLPDIVLD